MQKPNPTTPVRTNTPNPSTSTVAETPVVMPVNDDAKPVHVEPSNVRADEAKADTRTPITVVFSEKLAKQVRLLASLNGTTLTAVVQAAVERDVPAKLKAALAELDPEVRG